MNDVENARNRKILRQLKGNPMRTYIHLFFAQAKSSVEEGKCDPNYMDDLILDAREMIYYCGNEYAECFGAAHEEFRQQFLSSKVDYALPE